VESIATEIAIMKNGGLVAFAAPEVLLQHAGGSVWDAVLSSEAFEQVRTTLKISNAVRKSDGVHVRIVSPQKPALECSPAEPALEDAFLLHMNFPQVTQ
jgi:ABC-2 type transport system ATP-binding protein